MSWYYLANVPGRLAGPVHSNVREQSWLLKLRINHDAGPSLWQSKALTRIYVSARTNLQCRFKSSKEESRYMSHLSHLA